MTFLYNGEEIVVKHFPGESEYLVVSFMFGGRTDFAEKEFFLQEVQKKINIELIGISTKVGKWYISHEMDDVIKIIKNFSNKKIICIGVSMGGFGALKYGRAFGAFSVLSFAPQWSINPDDLIDNPNEGEREVFSKNFSDNMSNMSIKNENISERTCIVYDPANHYDKYHVKKIIENTDKIDTIKSFYTGHPVVESLSGSSNMKNILDYMSDYNFSHLRELITQIRRKHPENIKRKIDFCIDKKPVESILCLASKSMYNIKYKEKIFSDFRFLGRLLYRSSSSKIDLSKNIVEAILKNNFSTGIKLKSESKFDEYLFINSCGGILTYDPIEGRFQIEYNFIFPNKCPVFSLLRC